MNKSLLYILCFIIGFLIYRLDRYNCIIENLETRTLSYEDYLKKHKPDAGLLISSQNREEIYNKNVNYINEQNSKNLPYKLGINNFTHLTLDEVIKHYTGLKKPKKDNRLLKYNIELDEQILYENHINFRTNENPINKKLVTSVKEQSAACGNCWSYAIAACIEGALLKNIDSIDNIDDYSISNQFIADNYCWRENAHNICGGADPGAVITNIYQGKQYTPIHFLKRYPNRYPGLRDPAKLYNFYTNINTLLDIGDIRNSPGNNNITSEQIKKVINYYTQLAILNYKVMKDTIPYAIKLQTMNIIDLEEDPWGNNRYTALKTGPITVAVCITPAWNSYQTGILCNSYVDEFKDKETNHIVTIVGCDYDKDVRNPDPPYRIGMYYWIIKNSWGTLHGENGYFKVRRSNIPGGDFLIHSKSNSCIQTEVNNNNPFTPDNFVDPVLDNRPKCSQTKETYDKCFNTQNVDNIDICKRDIFPSICEMDQCPKCEDECVNDVGDDCLKCIEPLSPDCCLNAMRKSGQPESYC